MTYTILRGKRKTVSICVHQDGRVEVRAPMRMPIKTIDGFVKEKEPWIVQKLAQFSAMREKLSENMKDNTLPYMGVSYPIRDTEGTPFFSQTEWYLPRIARAEAADALLRKLAADYIPQRVALLADRHGFTYAGIHITSARTRFGSCSGKNSLNFTRYLIMYDADAIDYVILHELCHTVHHDHSSAFYALLGQICPDYETQRTRLRSKMFLGNLIRALEE